jgi:KH domain
MSSNGGDSNTATMSAEEAVQRAREIAARLSGHSVSSTTPAQGKLVDYSSNVVTAGNTTQEESNNDMNGSTEPNMSDNQNKKRKRWGVMPVEATVGGSVLMTIDPTATEAAAASRAKALAAVAKAISPSALSAMVAVAKPKQPPVVRRVWVAAMLTEERPAAHFVAYCHRHFPDVLSKVNTKQQDAINSNDDTATNKSPDKDDLVSIEFKGKGASEKPPILGMPEEPLHVHIHGPKLLVDQAELMVDDLLEQAKTAPIEDDAINARLAAEGALTVLSGGSSMPIQSTSSYRPASVAQLIGQANIPMEQRLLDANAVLIEETIGVPNGIVGFIIGRGGENIASMQSKTGCKVQIQKEHELQPGQTEREITLQAVSQEAVNACRVIIEGMVAERIKSVGGNSNSRGNYNDANRQQSQQMQQQQQQPQDPVQLAVSNGHKLVEVDVPDADVGLVIGKGGGTYMMGKIFYFLVLYRVFFPQFHNMICFSSTSQSRSNQFKNKRVRQFRCQNQETLIIHLFVHYRLLILSSRVL